MALIAAESRVLLAALLEFAASRESDFSTLREYNTFLEVEGEDVNLKQLVRKLGLETAVGQRKR